MFAFKLWLLGLIIPATSYAQDAVTLSAQRYAQTGFGHPSVTIHANVDGHLAASLRCAGRSFSQDTQISPGTNVTLTLKNLPTGQHACSGRISLRTPDGGTGEMPLNVEVAMLEPLKLAVPIEDLDLESNLLRVSSSRPLSHVSVDVLGPNGESIGSGETPVANMDRAELQWSQQPGEAVKLVVTGMDIYKLPGQLELSPWSYSIPHDDIVFNTGQSSITEEEAPKLESAWAELTKVVAKYGKVVQVNLYIAGYTDTVGNAANNRALSLQRARAIAHWFHKRGFGGEIHYQGFGEAALAVPTADETPEAANRRAAYILAAQKPARSAALPTNAWTRLK